MDLPWAELEALYRCYRSGYCPALERLQTAGAARLAREMAHRRDPRISLAELSEICRDAFVEAIRRATRSDRLGQVWVYARKTARTLLRRRGRRLPPGRSGLPISSLESEPPDPRSAVPFLIVDESEELDAFTKALKPQDARIFQAIVDASPKCADLARELKMNLRSLMERRKRLRRLWQAWRDRGSWGRGGGGGEPQALGKIQKKLARGGGKGPLGFVGGK